MGVTHVYAWGESADCFMINPEVEPKKQEPYIKSVDNTVENGPVSC